MSNAKTLTLAERYDRSLRYGRGKHVPADAARPLPSAHWHPHNLSLFECYENWLYNGGASEAVMQTYYLPMAGHVFGLTLKHHSELDLENDLMCALDYVKAKGVGVSWLKICRLALLKFRRFLRLERGLGEESKVTPFDVPKHTQGLPAWVVNELERYQKVQQRNWREARIDLNLRGFWNKHTHMWRFLVEERGVQELADVKRQFVLDYLDLRLRAGLAVTGVNNELRLLHTFLLFLQEEGYQVPNSLLRIPGLKIPDSLPKHLTDEQVRKLRDEIERGVCEQKVASRRREALLVRAAFYLLWQGGMRVGEVEELRLEDFDFPQKRLSARDGKGRKDRTVYLAETAIHALQEYLAVRGQGSGDHVFLFHNAPLKKDLIRAQLKYAGERVGVKVYPHRLRHTCATQLLNAGCRVTSIQRFLGHKKLSSTMIYARAHDQTVAEDYFAAMLKVEERLALDAGQEASAQPKENTYTERSRSIEVVKVQDKVFQLIIQRLEIPELCFEERLSLAGQLRQALGTVCHATTEGSVEAHEHAPPVFLKQG